jgi:GNAT superfamily N-acetyltransferase
MPRPATQTDLRGIAELYNHYVQETNSIVTEDQALIAEEDIDHLLRRCKSEKLPVIVAVRGRMLLSSRPQLPSRHPQRSKLALPQVEGIIGFGFAESYNYGIGGLRTGRSRVTASLQFYVHPECTRKGIGSDLLDRLIQLMSSSYG